MPFLPPNQQRQSAEGKKRYKTLNNKTLILQSLGYYFRFCDGMTGIFRSWSMRQNRLASMVARLIRSPGRVVHGVHNPDVAASSHRVNFPWELPGSRDTAAVDAMASRPELDAVVRRVCARPIAWNHAETHHCGNETVVNQSCIFSVVQVTKSLQDPLEVGNYLPGISDNVREWGLEQKVMFLNADGRLTKTGLISRCPSHCHLFMKSEFCVWKFRGRTVAVQSILKSPPIFSPAPSLLFRA